MKDEEGAVLPSASGLITDAVSPTAAQKPPLGIERRGDVAWLTFDRPARRNAMNPALGVAMHRALDEIEADDRVRAVVLRGAEGNFSAGMDVHEFLLAPAAEGALAIKRARDEAHGWWQRLRWLPRPTIALVEGFCIGGAFAPLAACDVAIAAEDARFQLPEIDMGMIAVANITKIVGEAMGLRKAAFHLLSGLPFDGRRAEAYGLVTEAVPTARIEERVTEIAGLLATKNMHAVQAIKEALRRVMDMTYGEAEDYLEIRQLALDARLGGDVASRVAEALAAKAGGR